MSDWRFMGRDWKGLPALRPGSDVITALKRLCEYEDACEAAGVEGPEALIELLESVATEKGRCENRTLRKPLESAQRIGMAPIGKHCVSCEHFVPDPGNPRKGHCSEHPRMVHRSGHKYGPMIPVEGERRPVVARRNACKEYRQKDDAEEPTAFSRNGKGKPPEWVGPSAELLPEETQAAGRIEKTADKQGLSLQSELGGNS